MLVVITIWSIQVETIDGVSHTLDQEIFNTFEMVEITTIRSSRGEERNDLWRGVRLVDIMNHFGFSGYHVTELLAFDKYLIRMNPSMLAEYDPIIALERNSVPIQATRLRLVSDKMIEMFWIAGIEIIREVPDFPMLMPKRIITYHTVLDQVRLHVNPAPFVDVKGYQMRDILRWLDTFNTNHPLPTQTSPFERGNDLVIRLVSTDGIEQILNFNDYFYNAVLLIVGELFSIFSLDMTAGMWPKDIMLMEINQNVIFFYITIDKENNLKYQELLKFISQREWTARFGTHNTKITDFEELRWENVVYIY